MRKSLILVAIHMYLVGRGMQMLQRLERLQWFRNHRQYLEDILSSVVERPRRAVSSDCEWIGPGH